MTLFPESLLGRILGQQDPSNRIPGDKTGRQYEVNDIFHRLSFRFVTTPPSKDQLFFKDSWIFSYQILELSHLHLPKTLVQSARKPGCHGTLGRKAMPSLCGRHAQIRSPQLSARMFIRAASVLWGMNYDFSIASVFVGKYKLAIAALAKR